MSKKGNAGNNKGFMNKAKPSFFQEQEQRLGPTYMRGLNAEIIQKNAMRIFKDLATGAINVDRDFQIFMNYDLVYNLLVAAQNNVNYNYYSYYGLMNSPVYPSDPNMQRIAAQHHENYVVYSIVVTHLNNILRDISCTNGAYVRFLLHQLVSQIRNCRVSFNGYFITILNEDMSQRQPQQQQRTERRRNDHDQRSDRSDEGSFFRRTDKNSM